MNAFKKLGNQDIEVHTYLAKKQFYVNGDDLASHKIYFYPWDSEFE